MQNRMGLRVLAAWVVDTTGAPEPATMVIVDSPDARLSASVCRFALTMRFQPAQSGGRPVRARFEYSFTFNALPLRRQ